MMFTLKQVVFLITVSIIMFGFIGFYSGVKYPNKDYAELTERHQALKELNGLCADMNNALIDTIDPTYDFLDTNTDEIIDDYLNVPEESRASLNEIILDTQVIWLDKITNEFWMSSKDYNSDYDSGYNDGYEDGHRIGRNDAWRYPDKDRK